MAHPLSFLAGAGMGVGAMYLLDPRLGPRRRALMRDQFIHGLSKAGKAADVVQRDAANRIYGTMAELRSVMRHEEPSDDVLVARVRAKIGRCVSHPAAIEVDAFDGCVWLSGPILADEVDCLLSNVWRVRGVHNVQSALEIHDEPGNISALQGGRRRTGEPFDLMQEYWSPTTRAVVGATGVGLMATCLAKSTPITMLLGTVGFGLSARALTNLQTRRLLGGGRSRRGIDIQGTANIAAPIDEVFELFSHPENYSRLTDVITSVRNLGGGRYQKTVRLPGGAEMTLDERLTTVERNRLIRWRSEPSSMVRYAGTAWFNVVEDGRTQVQVCMTYNPPGGVFSHVASALAGVNPKFLMDDFLMRAKTYLETGRQPRDAAEKRQPTVGGVMGASSPMQAGEAVTHDL